MRVDEHAALISASKLDSVQEGVENRLLLAEEGGVFPDTIASQNQPVVTWRRGTRAVLFLLCGFVSFVVLPMVWSRLQPALQSQQLHETNVVTLVQVALGMDDIAENATIPTSTTSSEPVFARVIDSDTLVIPRHWLNANIPTNSTSSELGFARSFDRHARVKGTAQNAIVPTSSTSSEVALVRDIVQNASIPTSSTSSKPAVTTQKNSSDWPSLFCVSLMQPHGPELALMKSHFARGVGVFACDDQAVFCSGGRIALGDAGWGSSYTLPVPNIKMSKGNVAIPGQTTNSWLNTKMFTNVYEAMLKDGRFWKHDWVIKVDPDAVFFPNRLRKHVAPLTGLTGPDALYIRNCGKNPYIHLLGAIEVFSKAAMQTYFDKKWKCESELHWEGWGEDYYMEHCLNHLGVQYVDDYKLLGQSTCEFAPCQNSWFAAFHPFKDVDSWWQCWNSSEPQF